LEEYYLTNDEIEVLKSSAADIVKHISSGSMVIELGSGWVIQRDKLITAWRSLISLTETFER